MAMLLKWRKSHGRYGHMKWKLTVGDMTIRVIPDGIGGAMIGYSIQTKQKTSIEWQHKATRLTFNDAMIYANNLI